MPQGSDDILRWKTLQNAGKTNQRCDTRPLALTNQPKLPQPQGRADAQAHTAATARAPAAAECRPPCRYGVQTRVACCPEVMMRTAPTKQPSDQTSCSAHTYFRHRTGPSPTTLCNTPNMPPQSPQIRHALWHARLKHTCSPAQPIPAHRERPDSHTAATYEGRGPPPLETSSLAALNAHDSTISFRILLCPKQDTAKHKVWGRLLWSWHSAHQRPMIHGCMALATRCLPPAGWPA